MLSSSLKLRVLYAHTDKMGVVYYGRYYEYFEAGRNEFLRSIGYPYSVIESHGLVLPVIESHCNYFASAHYDDEITQVTFLDDLPTVRIKMKYVIYNSNGLKLAEGYTVHSFVNATTRKPSRPPADFIELLKIRFNRK